MKGKISADLVLIKGIVYSADRRDTVYEAVAVKGSRIVFVGSDAEAAKYIGKDTRVIDLQGKMVIPGLIDTHVHPPGLSLAELYEVQLCGLKSLAEYVETVKDFRERHPGAAAVFGRGWLWSVFSGDELTKGPRKEHLDAVVPDIPVVLRAMDGHTLWVNTKALLLNGITAETEAPPGGVVEKDPLSGELWGTLKEGAAFLIAQPEYNLNQYMNAMAAFQRKMHRFGITGVFCIAGQSAEDILQACEQLALKGELFLRIRVAVVIQPGDDLPRQFAAVNRLRRRYASSFLQVIAVKFFTDGVVEGGTGYLLKPYTTADGKDAGYHGEFFWDPEQLRQAFCLANARGLQIIVHSIGDASTRKVLDALAFARTQFPSGDYRNTITHLQLVDQADVPRFKDLNVIASVQPYWHFKGPSWWEKVDWRLLGERAEEEYPLGTLFAHGITVTSSSDYPLTAVPDPLAGIEIGVTRNIDNGGPHGVEDISDMDDPRYLLNKQERATVRQMLRSFTLNGAYAMFMDRETGSLEAGKLADLAVLDRDLLQLNPVDIGKVKVVMTFLGGKLVYEQCDA